MCLLKPLLWIALLRLGLLHHEDVSVGFEAPPGDRSASQQRIKKVGLKGQLHARALNLADIVKVLDKHLAVGVPLKDLDEVSAIQTPGENACVTCIEWLIPN